MYFIFIELHLKWVLYRFFINM